MAQPACASSMPTSRGRLLLRADISVFKIRRAQGRGRKLLRECARYTQYANCRAVSPRRLDIHAVVSVAFGISGVKEEEIITGAEGAGIQLRCCDSRTASLVACTETAFPMSETVPLPDGDPAVSCVLSAQAAALAQEIKVISNKLLVKGELTVSAVCRGEGGEIFSFGHSMPISQIINLEGIDEDCTCCVCLPVTSLEVLPKADQAATTD